MKKKQAIRLKDFFPKDKIVIFVFMIAITLGAIYALLIKDTSDKAFILLNNYFSSEEGVQAKGNLFFPIAYRYFKQLILIWLLGLFSLTAPLGMLVFFGIVFSYAFTTTYLLLGYGIQGLLIGFFTYGIQSIVMVSMGMYLSIESIRKNNKHMTEHYGYYSFSIIPITIGVCLASLADTIIVSKFNFITQFIL